MPVSGPSDCDKAQSRHDRYALRRCSSRSQGTCNRSHLPKANGVRVGGQSLKPARATEMSASAIVEPVGTAALLKRLCQCESGPKRLAPSDSQRSAYRARLIGSIASSSRSKSMQASLRPSASADVSPLRASSFCDSIRLYATSDSRIPEVKREASVFSFFAGCLRQLGGRTPTLRLFGTELHTVFDLAPQHGLVGYAHGGRGSSAWGRATR